VALRSITRVDHTGGAEGKAASRDSATTIDVQRILVKVSQDGYVTIALEHSPINETMHIRNIVLSARKHVSLTHSPQSQPIRVPHTTACKTRFSLVKSVTIPPGTKEYYLDLLKPWIPGATIYRKDCYAVQGALLRCTYAIPTGRLYMRSLHELATSFAAKAVRNPSKEQPSVQLSHTALLDIQWWREWLSSPSPSAPGSEGVSAGNFFTDNCQPRIFVDASSWGIGLIVNDHWFAWQFAQGWDTDGRDIHWAEMVAIELALRYIASSQQFEVFPATRLAHGFIPPFYFPFERR